MLLSFDHDFLFVHIPKTGGTSIRQALAPFAQDPKAFWQNRMLGRLGINFNLVFGNYQSYCFRKHADIQTVQKRMPASVLDSMLKFSFVRNPWDLLVSNYSYILNRPKHKRHRRVRKLSFSEFIPFAAAKGIGFQKRMLSDSQGQMQVDQIGKFENLQSDFADITSRLMVIAPLPHLNQVRRADYRDFYDPRTRDQVAMIYREDIETFEYEFHPQVARSRSRRRAA